MLSQYTCSSIQTIIELHINPVDPLHFASKAIIKRQAKTKLSMHNATQTKSLPTLYNEIFKSSCTQGTMNDQTSVSEAIRERIRYQTLTMYSAGWGGGGGKEFPSSP